MLCKYPNKMTVKVHLDKDKIPDGVLKRGYI